MKRISYLIILLVIAGTGLVGGWAYTKYFKKSTPPLLTFTAATKSITETIRARGEVVPKKEYALSFESPGVIKTIAIKEGQRVEAQSVLMEQDTSGLVLEQKKLELQLTQSRAALDSQEAKLAEMQKGTRAEELQVALTSVNNAKRSLTFALNRYADANNYSEKELARLEKAKEDAVQSLRDITAKADIDIASLYNGVKDVVASVYSSANSAVNTEINELFENTNTTYPSLTFVVTDSQTKIDTENQRVLAGTAVSDVKRIFDTLPVSQSGLDAALVECNSSLLTIRSFLVRLNQAVNNAGNVTPTKISTYKGDVEAALDAINAAISSITVKQDALSLQKQINVNLINSANIGLNSATKALEVGRSSNQKLVTDAKSAVNEAENAVSLTQEQYNLKRAGSTPEGLRAQEAVVQQSIAANDIIGKQIAIIRNQLGKAVLRAPEEGVVSQVLIEEGEVVVPGQIVVSLLSDGYQIQTDLSEFDINKVKSVNGNKVRVALDSMPGEEYQGDVISIDPKEIVKEGDSYYRVNIALDFRDAPIRTGMKADLFIIGSSIKSAIVLPEIALTKSGGKTYVRVLRGGGYQDAEVVTGISDGQNIEIIKGLTDGQVVSVGN